MARPDINKVPPPPEHLYLRGQIPYHQRWENKDKNLPGPGAGSWAWETYGLPSFSPIGTGVHAMSHRPRAFYGPPAFSMPGTIIAGIPVIAGQIITQPLINPYWPQTTVMPSPNIGQG